MSEMIAFGARHAAHGQRGNVNGLKSLPFTASRNCCWRRARVRSDSSGAHSFLRMRTTSSASSPLRWFSPFWNRWVRPSNRDRMHFSNVMSTPPSASTNFGNPLKSTSIRWFTSMPRNCLIVSIISGGPPIA